MKLIKTILIILAVIVLAVLAINNNATAQQQATFSQFMFNPLAINPAYAGHDERLSLTFLSRIQSVGVDGAPNTQTFSAHTPLLNERVGVGLMIVHDNIGVIDQLGITGMYSYRIMIDDAVITMGLQVGFSSYEARYGDLDVPISNDPAFNENIKSTRPNFGTGIYYEADKLRLGIALPHLVNNVFDRGANQITVNQLRPLLISGGYTIDFNHLIQIQPNFLVKFVDSRAVELQLNANVTYADRITAGLTLRPFNSLDFLAQAKITDQIHIGYSYNVTTNSLRLADLGSHEFFVNFRTELFKIGGKTPSDGN